MRRAALCTGYSRAPVTMANWRSPLLAFLSGYVDTAVFIHMGGLFVAHVTGNFVLLGAALVGQSRSDPALTALQLAAFPLFVLAAALAAVIADRVGGTRSTPTLLSVAAATMIIAALASMCRLISDGPVALCYAVAMGLLNAAQRLDAGLGPPFTVMTGNVTGVAIAIARRIGLARGPKVQSAPGSTSGMLLLVAGFTLGSAAGAAAQTILAMGAVILPATLLAVFLAVDRPRRA